MKLRMSWKRIAGGIAVLAFVSIAAAVAMNLSTISQTVKFMSRFSIDELVVLVSDLTREDNPFESTMIVLRMRADRGAIREAPDPNSAAVSTVPAGTPLQALSETRAWYLVEPKDGAEGPSFRKGHVSVSDVEWTVDCAPADIGNPGPGDRFRDCEASPEMVVVPAGRFTMGSPESEAHRDADEGPQRTVTIAAPFALGVHEVTFEQWDACWRTGGCGTRRPNDVGNGRGRHPVANVSWNETQRYVQWLSAITGKRYRLPSEAEWEYAARAGVGTTSLWPGAGEESAWCRYMNGYDHTAAKASSVDLVPLDRRLPCTDRHGPPAIVGSFLPNPFGLHDMLGNLEEWTQDCHNPGYSGAPTDGSAWETGRCDYRMSRGGAWAHGFERLRMAGRTAREIDSTYSSRGLRVARDLD